MQSQLKSFFSINLLASLLILFYVFQASVQVLTHSITFDEPLHVRSGLEWISLGFSPSDPLSPPLSKLPFGILQLLNIDLLNDPYLLVARFSMVLFAMLFLFYFYYFTKKHFNEKVALFSLLFLSLEPSFIAYTHLANSETITLICFFLVYAAGIEFIKNKASTKALIFFLLSLVLLYLAKSVFLPAFIFLIFAVILKAKSLSLSEIFKSLFTAVMVFFVLIFLLTGFNSYYAYGNYLSIPGGGIVNSTLTSINYVTDPAFIETRLIVFNSSVSHEGSILYTPISFFIKISPHLLILSISFIIFYIWKEKSKNKILNQGVLLIFTTLLLVSIGSYNIGIRHLLPIIPILAIFSALMIMIILSKFKHFGKILVLILIFLSILYCILTTDKIIYFNPLIGSEKGSRLITESNFDWGQSLPALKKEGHKIDYLISYSPIEANKYGISSFPLPDGWESNPDKLKGKNVLISHTQYYKSGLYHHKQFNIKFAKNAAGGTFLIFKF